jgi:O-antigen/teichoic acid export membrane protein
MSTGGSLLRGSALRTLDLCVVVACSFFITPYLVHSLGDRVYGFWTLVAAVIGYYGLLDLGLSSAAARYMSQALGKGDVAELDRVASTAFSLFIGVGAAVVLATFASAFACRFFVHQETERALFQRLLVLMGASAALGVIAKVYIGMLSADIRYDVIAAISIARTLACSAGIYACLRAGRGIVAVAVVTLAASAAQLVGLYAAFKARFPRVEISARLADRSRIGGMLGYGSKTLVCQVGDVLRFRLDSTLIAGFLSAALVTPYAVGVRLVEGFGQLVLSSTGMMLPVFSQYEGRGDYDSIRESLLKATKLSTMLSVFIGSSIIFYGRAFIQRWMGPGYDSSYWVATILCVGFIIELPQSPGVQLLFGLSRHKVYAVLTVCEGVANLAFSVLLLKRFGIYGVALGTTLELAVFKLLVQPIYICRSVGLPVRAYLLRSILSTLLRTAAPLALYFRLVARFVTPSYGAIAACAAAQTLLFIPAAYFLVLDGSERAALAAVVGAFRAQPAES